ncbi:MAG TPA: hypothetical protein DDW53_10305 [Lachnoclostridium sp.]|nr:hypothetical protein [Lachnoclostridium sp.]
MKRSMMQAYVTRSDEAVALYQKAFDAALISSYPNSDGTYYHAELDIQGEILAVAEINSEAPCQFSPLMTDFIDKYGIRWCLFV